MIKKAKISVKLDKYSKTNSCDTEQDPKVDDSEIEPKIEFQFSVYTAEIYLDMSLNIEISKISL